MIVPPAGNTPQFPRLFAKNRKKPRNQRTGVSKWGRIPTGKLLAVATITIISVLDPTSYQLQKVGTRCYPTRIFTNERREGASPKRGASDGFKRK